MMSMATRSTAPDNHEELPATTGEVADETKWSAAPGHKEMPAATNGEVAGAIKDIKDSLASVKILAEAVRSGLTGPALDRALDNLHQTVSEAAEAYAQLAGTLQVKCHGHGHSSAPCWQAAEGGLREVLENSKDKMLPETVQAMLYCACSYITPSLAGG